MHPNMCVLCIGLHTFLFSGYMYRLHVFIHGCVFICLGLHSFICLGLRVMCIGLHLYV